MAIDSLRLVRKIVAQSPLQRFAPQEHRPGPEAQSDADLLAAARSLGTTIFHPVGTAKMGLKTDPMAVVDEECRVIGVAGLRVADSSIFPQVTNGNLNGPSIMTGEKAADHILGRRLAKSNLQPVINENWRVSQR